MATQASRRGRRTSDSGVFFSSKRGASKKKMAIKATFEVPSLTSQQGWGGAETKVVALHPLGREESDMLAHSRLTQFSHLR